MERPESDFDTAERGNALISYAAMYRDKKPNATLSEISDSFSQMAALAGNPNGAINGNGLNGVHRKSG